MLMTLEEARGWLLAAVETQGRDFVYATEGSGGCYYIPKEQFGDKPQGRTGCLIGTALTLAGREVPDLGSIISYHQELFQLSPEATVYFRCAQSWQDSGSTWGDAYDYAEGTVTHGH